MRSGLICCIVGLSAGASGASAHLFNFVFGMNGHSVVDPTDSEAGGVGRVVYNHHTFTYDLDLRITGVGLGDLLDTGPNGTPLQIFHAPRGQNGDIVLDPGYFGDFVQDGDGIRLTVQLLRLGGQQGSFSSSVFANQEWMYDGDLYIQLFTQQYPGGEIRGQLPPFGKQLGNDAGGGFAGLDGPPGRARIPAPASAGLLIVAGLSASRRRR